MKLGRVGRYFLYRLVIWSLDLFVLARVLLRKLGKK